MAGCASLFRREKGKKKRKEEEEGEREDVFAGWSDSKLGGEGWG